MADPISVSAAAAEVNAAKQELANSIAELNRLEIDMYHAERRRDLAQIRVEEASRVLLETASE